MLEVEVGTFIYIYIYIYIIYTYLRCLYVEMHIMSGVSSMSGGRKAPRPGSGTCPLADRSLELNMLELPKNEENT